MKNRISPTELWNLIGTANAPSIVDVRIAEDIADIPFAIPGSVSRPYDGVAGWADQFAGKIVVITCHKGLKLSEGVAAQLRLRGIATIVLEGGSVAWRDTGLPAIRNASLPGRIDGITRWVTRERPKIDRIACPWLIRRFVDPSAEFLFVETSQANGVAERFNATPFDIDGVFWSHRGETCTFDAMIDEFGLSCPALETVAQIVRGADTARLDLARKPPGCLPFRSACRAIFTMTWHSLTPECLSMTRSIPGRGTGRAKRTIGLQRHQNEPANLSGSHPDIPQDRPVVLRRTGRADRADAPHSGG